MAAELAGFRRRFDVLPASHTQVFRASPEADLPSVAVHEAQLLVPVDLQQAQLPGLPRISLDVGGLAEQEVIRVKSQDVV